MEKEDVGHLAKLVSLVGCSVLGVAIFMWLMQSSAGEWLVLLLLILAALAHPLWSLLEKFKEKEESSRKG